MSEHRFITEFRNKASAKGWSLRQIAKHVDEGGSKLKGRTLLGALSGEFPLSFDVFVVLREYMISRGVHMQYDAVDFYNDRKATHNGLT